MINMDLMYSLDEIGLIPAITSDISHRSDINPYRTEIITNGIVTQPIDKLPIFVAPMTSIINDDNFNTFNSSKVIPIHPRTERVDKYIIPSNNWVAMSLSQFKHWFNDCKAPDNQHYKVLIDVANGHMQEIYDCVRDAKQEYGNNLTVMIGNIANPNTYYECCRAGVDYVRVGIGGGSACTTGVQTGIHASMVWLLSIIASERKDVHSDLEFHKNHPDYNTSFLTETKVIADGGINTIDRAIKCLALGADYIMMGKLFAQCEEACGERREVPDDGYHIWKFERKYYGMASIQGQKDISGGVNKNPEGIETWVPIKYTLKQFATQFEAALVSCMSYCGASNLNEFIGKVEWIPMTSKEFKSYYK